jgi:hypothetical protein
MAIPFRLRCTPAGTISCALRLMVAASESLCYKFSQFLIPFCKRFSGVLVNFMGIMVSISFLLLLYESMFYSPPLPSYRKKKGENFDVFIFANGPNFGRGGVEVYNNFVVWI